METKTVKLYSLDYSNARTYLMAALFIAGNMALPQLFHLIPQGGITWLPIYFFTLIGAYKFGWKVGLLTAILSPIINSLLFGMPLPAVLPAILRYHMVAHLFLHLNRCIQIRLEGRIADCDPFSDNQFTAVRDASSGSASRHSVEVRITGSSSRLGSTSFQPYLSAYPIGRCTVLSGSRYSGRMGYGG